MKKNRFMVHVLFALFVLSLNTKNAFSETKEVSTNNSFSFFDDFFFNTKSFFGEMENFFSDFETLNSEIEETEDCFIVTINGLNEFDKDNITIDVDLENLILVIEASLQEALNGILESEETDTTDAKVLEVENKGDEDQCEADINDPAEFKKSEKSSFYSYTIKLPKNLNLEKEIEHSFENGTLKLSFAKKDSPILKNISINL